MSIDKFGDKMETWKVKEKPNSMKTAECVLKFETKSK